MKAIAYVHRKARYKGLCSLEQIVCSLGGQTKSSRYQQFEGVLSTG